jgi:hypothetical protein
MNYIKHLTGFFDKVAKDTLLNPTHISLYIALFQFWNCNRFKNPISISRDEVMRISKISSKATYHKCLKALHSQGYIKYEPSYNPFRGSHVYLFNFSDDMKPLSKTEKNSSPNFEPVGKQVADKLQAGTKTSPEPIAEQVLVPSINNTNNTNNINISNIENGLNLEEPEKKIEEEISNVVNENISKEEKNSAKKEEMPQAFSGTITEQSDDGPQKETVKHIREVFSRPEEKPPESIFPNPSAIPQLQEVLTYFSEQDFPALEANKFFNYFQSIGWLVGGKTPMADWPAAARNWMLNAPNYVKNERTDRTKHLDNTAGKDYSEPL